MARLNEAPHRRHPWSAPALAYVARALSSNRVCHVSDRSFLGGNQNPAFGLGIFIAPARLLARQYYASAPFLGLRPVPIKSAECFEAGGVADIGWSRGRQASPFA